MTTLDQDQVKTFDRIDPIENKRVSSAVAMDVDRVRQIADGAGAAFKTWSQTSPGERRMLLLKAADAFEKRSDDLVKYMMLETGAAPSWCGFNVMLAAKMLREAAAVSYQLIGETLPSDSPGLFSTSVRRPAGVSLGIAPWNAPIILATRAIAVPLACGNTVILKASEQCPALHQLLGEIIKSAGFPPNVINVVTNAPEDAAAVVEALITHPKVRRVNFTGSTHVGRIIGRLSGYHLKPALLELGGKAPFVVLADANLDDAVNGAAFGAFMHQGQICMSTERILVDETVADAFVAKLVAKARSLSVGNPRTQQVVLGSLIGAEPIKKIQELIADAVGKGGKVVAGGDANGTFMQATVIDHVTTSMRLFYEETFGPSVSVTRFKTDVEAIALANDTEYGLSAAVFGSDIKRALKVAMGIESGLCHINGPTVQDEAHIPFGGVKGSGYGRFGGRAGIEFFTDTRWITMETEDHHYPF